MSPRYRHRAPSELAAANFWPGYVDALTNVVLNLLFLVAILAMGIFAIGLAVARNAAIGQTGGSSAISRVMAIAHGLEHRPGTGTITATPFPVSALKPQPDVALAPPLETYTLDTTERPVVGSRISVGQWGSRGARTMLTVQYLDDSVVLDETSKAAILQRIDQLASTPAARERAGFTIWTVADTAHSRQTRGSFFRLMALRDLLVAHGIRPEAIRTSISSGLVGSDEIGNSARLFLIIDESKVFP